MPCFNTLLHASMVNSNLLLGLWDLTLSVQSTGPESRPVYRVTSVPPFPIHKVKIELSSFYCALWAKAEKESIKTFSFVIFVLICLKSELYQRLREVEQHKNTKNWRREKPLLLSRASWKTGLLVHRKFCHFKLWFQCESEQNPKSFQIPLKMEILRISVWKCWSRVFLIPTPCPRPAKLNQLSCYLTVVLPPASLRRWVVSWGHLRWHCHQEPLWRSGSFWCCWTSRALHSQVLAPTLCL